MDVQFLPKLASCVFDWEIDGTVPGAPVGTEIYHNTPGGFIPDAKWSASLNKDWDASLAKEMGLEFEELELQNESEQRPHKVSFKISATGEDAERVVESLRAKLECRMKTLVIFSGREDVDILPMGAGKGKALGYLLDELEGRGDYPSAGALVAGDSGNDVELFEVPGVQGCIVGNAHVELRLWIEANPSDRIFEATKTCASGILEALTHFEKYSEDPRDQLQLARFVSQSFSTAEDLVPSLHDGFQIIASDGRKRSGKEAALSSWETTSSIRWLDRLDLESLGDSWLVTFCDWRLHDDRKVGFAVSGIVACIEEGFRWQFMHFTSIT